MKRKESYYLAWQCGQPEHGELSQLYSQDQKGQALWGLESVALKITGFQDPAGRGVFWGRLKGSQVGSSG